MRLHARYYETLGIKDYFVRFAMRDLARPYMLVLGDKGGRSRNS